jgi:hypothetical protein
MYLKGIDLEQLLSHFSMVAQDSELELSFDSVDGDTPKKSGCGLSLSFFVSFTRYWVQLALVMMSCLTLMACVYITDQMTVWFNPNGALISV